MNKLKKHLIRSILSELPALRDKKVINEETGKRISEYYTGLLGSYKERNKDRNKKLIVIFLSIIAALFISGGVILLIGYNWQMLAKNIKTIFAYLLLLIPQAIALYFIFLHKKEAGQGLKEGLSVLWVIIFGAVIALIGQIYRLPSNIDAFLFVWALSTLGIIYVFYSISSVVIFLVLIVSLASSMQIHSGIGLLFYPLYFSLLPLYIMETKEGSAVKTTILRYLLISAIMIGLGITLEKAVPGMWIVAYTNLFAVSFLTGVLTEKKDDHLLLSPLKIAGITGLLVFAFMLIFEWPWKDIGFLKYRGGGKFNELASLFDYGISMILFISNLILCRFILRKKERSMHNIIISLTGILIVLLFILVSFKFVAASTAAWLLMLFITAGIFFILFSGISGKTKASHLAFALVFMIPVMIRFTDATSKSHEFPGFFLLLISLGSLIFYVAGKYYDENLSNPIFKVFKFFGVFGLVCISYLCSFKDVYRSLKFSHSPLDLSAGGVFDTVMLYLILLSFLVAAYALLYLAIKHKISVNKASFALPAVLVLIIAGSIFVPQVMSPLIAMLIINLFILAFCLNGFYIGLKQRSLFVINGSAIFLTVNIVTRFFQEDISLLARGVVFILCGVFILFVNLFIIKKFKTGGQKQ